MKKNKFCLILIFLIIFFAGTAQVPFTAGNIVVYRVGTGAATLTSAAVAVFLDEYTVAGALVQSIALPVTVSGANHILTAAGTGATEGLMTLSTDGEYLVLTGYDAPVGTANIGASSSATRSRTIGLVRYDAAINTTTSLTDFSSGGTARAAVSTDGTALWACGNGTIGGTGGVRYAAVGSTTSTRLNAAGPAMLRSLYIIAGQLYVSGNSNSPRIGTVGTGLPTTAGQTVTNLPAFPTTGSPGQFVFADLNAGVAGVDVLYFTDATVGISKYSLVAGSWVLNGSVGSSADDYRGLAAKISGTTVTLFATAKGANSSTIEGGDLVSLTDATGYNGAFAGTPAVLVSAITDAAAFRGVALAPVQIIVVPIKLIAFTAAKINKDVKVSWSIASAINFSHFEVERSVTGGVFSRAGSVNFQTSNNSSTAYNFMDTGIINTAAFNNTLYYRLKMIDIDGRFEYSKIVTVAVHKKVIGLINVYPAPFTNEVFAHIGLLKAGNVSLSMIDAAGKIVRSVQLLLPTGDNTIAISNLNHLPKGIYLLQVTINNEVSSVKLIK